MEENIRISNSKKMMRWVLLPSLIIALLGSSSGKESIELNQSVDFFNSTDKEKSFRDLVLSSDHELDFRNFTEYDIEEVEDDRNFSNYNFSQTTNQAIVIYKITSISNFSSNKLIKLFILFHSWKSFLLT